MILSYPFPIFYHGIEKRKTKRRYIHGPISTPLCTIICSNEYVSGYPYSFINWCIKYMCMCKFNHFRYFSASTQRDLKISVGYRNNTDIDLLCQFYAGPLTSAETRRFDCKNPIFGRFVFIQRMDNLYNSLSLCEVKVFGEGEYVITIQIVGWWCSDQSSMVLSRSRFPWSYINSEKP